MFDFLADFGNYESRCVARHDGGDLFISTTRVSDGKQPYETAVQHPDYNDGKLVIVEAYGGADAAQAGHDKWLATMQASDLPGQLVDCSNSEVSQLAETVGCDTVFRRQSKSGQAA